jgi:hypothetical protein
VNIEPSLVFVSRGRIFDAHLLGSGIQIWDLLERVQRSRPEWWSCSVCRDNGTNFSNIAFSGNWRGPQAVILMLGNQRHTNPREQQLWSEMIHEHVITQNALNGNRDNALTELHIERNVMNVDAYLHGSASHVG